MANSYEYLSIFLLLSVCTWGGIGSESTYSCDLEGVTLAETAKLGDDVAKGKILDCIRIGWLEDQKNYGLRTGESAACSKAQSTDCQKTDQLTSSNDEFEFVEKFGNDALGLNVNCKIDLDDDKKRQIDVWKCGNDVLQRYYILKSASVPESTVSKTLIVLTVFISLLLFTKQT